MSKKNVSKEELRIYINDIKINKFLLVLKITSIRNTQNLDKLVFSSHKMMQRHHRLQRYYDYTKYCQKMKSC